MAKAKAKAKVTATASTSPKKGKSPEKIALEKALKNYVESKTKAIDKKVVIAAIKKNTNLDELQEIAETANHRLYSISHKLGRGKKAE